MFKGTKRIAAYLFLVFSLGIGAEQLFEFQNSINPQIKTVIEDLRNSFKVNLKSNGLNIPASKEFLYDGFFGLGQQTFDHRLLYFREINGILNLMQLDLLRFRETIVTELPHLNGFNIINIPLAVDKNNNIYVATEPITDDLSVISVFDTKGNLKRNININKNIDIISISPDGNRIWIRSPFETPRVIYISDQNANMYEFEEGINTKFYDPTWFSNVTIGGFVNDPVSAQGKYIVQNTISGNIAELTIPTGVHLLSPDQKGYVAFKYFEQDINRNQRVKVEVFKIEETVSGEIKFNNFRSYDFSADQGFDIFGIDNGQLFGGVSKEVYDDISRLVTLDIVQETSIFEPITDGPYFYQGLSPSFIEIAEPAR